MKLPNFKKSFFWEFTSVYALHLAWSLFHETNPKMIFLTICMPKNRIFCHFCPNLPKKGAFWGDRHNFFCICRFARLMLYVKGLLLYFQKQKIKLKLVNFSTHYSPLKRIYKTYIFCIFWSCKNFKMKLPNFNFFFIF